jgi:predicted ABC-type ATPase
MRGGRELTFAFETTLSGRHYARLIPAWREVGYAVKLVFLHLPSAETAIARIRQRVRRGGHHVPDDVVRRRLVAGLRNFHQLYKPLVDEWVLYDNSGDFPVILEAGRQR